MSVKQFKILFWCLVTLLFFGSAMVRSACPDYSSAVIQATATVVYPLGFTPPGQHLVKTNTTSDIIDPIQPLTPLSFVDDTLEHWRLHLPPHSNILITVEDKMTLTKTLTLSRSSANIGLEKLSGIIPDSEDDPVITLIYTEN